MQLADLASQHVVVWGSGLEGAAAARAAIRALASSVVVAVDNLPSGPETLNLGQSSVPIMYGSAAIEALLGAQVVIKSPSIPPYSGTLARLQASRTRLATGPQLWLEDNRARAIVVSGTKGKSTTATLLAHLMRTFGFDVTLGGNIGIPVLDLGNDHDWYVAEFSSYQCASVQCSPWGVVLTSLFPEHLNWHGDARTYYQDKLNIVRRNPAFVFANRESPILRQELKSLVDGSLVRWAPSDLLFPDQDGSLRLNGLELARPGDLAIRGRHNQINLALALLVLEVLGVDLLNHVKEVRQALADFHGLPHRLERVSGAGGLDWYDDSIATIPEATVAGLRSFEGRPVTLIVGGTDRGLSFKPLATYLSSRSAPVTVIAIPENGQHILSALTPVRGTHALNHVDSLVDAVSLASRITPPGGVVLLSPAAARGREFDCLDHRGQVFRESIAALGLKSKS